MNVADVDRDGVTHCLLLLKGAAASVRGSTRDGGATPRTQSKEGRMMASVQRSPLTVVAALCLAGAVALGQGCGGGGNNNQPNPTSTPTSTPTPVPTQAAGAGLVGVITSASIDADGVVTATFRVTDGSGVPLVAVLTATMDPQQVRVRFTIAQLVEYSGGGELPNTFFKYINQINPTSPAYDANGTLTLLGATTGTYRYTFHTKLPADYDRSLTYTVGMQGDRMFDGQELGADPVFDFVPAGGTPQIWNDTTTAQCNHCHQPLVVHGNRREVRLCELCHTQDATDPKGNTIDFRNMIHKIHAGIELPSVALGPPGSFYGIYSGFSQSYVIFAEKNAAGMVSGVAFPRHLEECAVCHSEGPTAEYYASKPSSAACASCHDDANPSLETTAAGPPGTNHPPGGYPDGQCYACHAATMTMEFDISVPGAHVVPERSTMLQGLKLTITNVANHAAGQTPTISFKVTNNAGQALLDLSVLNRLAFAMSGPTTDYTVVRAPTAVGGGASGTLAGPDADGVFAYTPSVADGIPATATGTWALGAEARQQVQLTQTVSTEEAAVNPVVTFTVDDSTPEPHRTIVENQNCSLCHGEFSLDFSIHGNLRNQIEYCEICHNATQSDAARRKQDPAAVAAGEDNASINTRVLLHKIHRGEELQQQPYIVYGFGPPPKNYTMIDFGEVRFSGDLRICDTCHVQDSQLIPPYPSTALPTLHTQLEPGTGNVIPAVPPEIQPITSVCTACHDSDDAIAHAVTNTAPDGTEACPVCHEEGRPFAVSVVHAERPFGPWVAPSQ
jgi:OmcA/MtrC family decaheme c-type cytochrome